MAVSVKEDMEGGDPSMDSDLQLLDPSKKEEPPESPLVTGIKDVGARGRHGVV